MISFNHKLLFIVIFQNNAKWILLLIQWNMFLNKVWVSQEISTCQKVISAAFVTQKFNCVGNYTNNFQAQNECQAAYHCGGGKWAGNQQAFQPHFIYCIDHPLAANLISITAAATRVPNKKTLLPETQTKKNLNN